MGRKNCMLSLYLNRSPTKSVKDKVPLEAWSGIKTSISHLKFFGYIAYAHVLEELRRKLVDRSEKYIFVGYIVKSQRLINCSI